MKDYYYLSYCTSLNSFVFICSREFTSKKEVMKELTYVKNQALKLSARGDFLSLGDKITYFVMRKVRPGELFDSFIDSRTYKYVLDNNYNHKFERL